MLNSPPTGLAVVSADRDTLKDVQAYFERAGLGVSPTSRLDDVQEMSIAIDAVILFADDYTFEDADRTLSDLATRLVVIVTTEIVKFSARREAWWRVGEVIVLPRPAWGFVLLDAVRVGLQDVGSHA